MAIRLFALTFILFFFSPASLFSQQKKNKYWVEFSDKNNSPFCTCRPAEFLSARALERRAKAGIAVVENDLPVNTTYVNALKINGIQIHSTSRWLNAATIISDSAAAESVKKLPFVKNIVYIGRHIPVKNPPNRKPKKRTPVDTYPKPEGGGEPGYTGLQNSLLNLPALNLAGHRGEGIWVAVMASLLRSRARQPLGPSVTITVGTPMRCRHCGFASSTKSAAPFPARK